MSCKVCQAFSSAKVSAQLSSGPGTRARAGDVFTHWSVDFAGPFPKDSETGCEYVIIAVEWVTRWAEAEATLDATAETAANFLYNRVICRYGCIESLQSDNGSHFANDIIRCLTETLRVRHHFSTPYYPQSNGRVERVVGTLKAMLKRTVAAAAVVAPLAASDPADIKVYGVDLSLDESILSAIAEAQAKRDAVKSEVDEDELAGKVHSVYWAPLLHTVL